MFGLPVQFNYEEGSQTYRSVTGSCISLLALFFTAIFLIQQAIVLHYYKDTTFTSSLVQNYLDQDFTYEGDEFPIAISMIDISEPDFKPKQGVTI